MIHLARLLIGLSGISVVIGIIVGLAALDERYPGFFGGIIIMFCILFLSYLLGTAFL